MASFVFIDPGAPRLARLYEGTTEADRAQVGTDVDIADLPADPDTGKLVLTVPAADATKAHWLAFGLDLGDGNVLWSDSVSLPGRSEDPGAWKVFVRTVDAGLGVLQGVKVVAEPAGGQVAAGDAMVAGRLTLETDATGYAEMLLPADAGEFKVTLAGEGWIFSTVGRAGTVVNLKDL